MPSDCKDSAPLNDLDMVTLRVTHHAFLHYHGVFPSKIAHRLVEVGYAKLMEENYDVDVVKKALSEAASKIESVAQCGPLLLVKTAEKKYEVMQLSELVFSKDQSVRKALTVLFDAWLQKSPDVATTFTRELLMREHEALTASGDDNWLKSAELVSDALEHDFFYNLAGMKQSIELRYDRGYTEFLSKVFRPTPEALSRLPVRLPKPSQDLVEIKRLIGQLVSEEASFNSALHKLFAFIGHLPIQSDYSFPGLVELWISDREPSLNVYEELCKWRDQIDSELPGYHCCAILMRRPDWIPQNRLEEFWNGVITVLDFSKTIDSETTKQQRWWLASCGLASHYSSFLYCIHPNQDLETVCNYAWWMADIVTRRLGFKVICSDGFIQQNVIPERQLWEQIRCVSYSECVKSSLYAMNVELSSVWSYALVSQCSNILMKHGLVGLKDQDSEYLGRLLHVYLFSVFNFSNVSDKDAYAFCEGLKDTVRALAPLLGTTELSTNILKLSEANSRFSADSHLLEALERLPDVEKDERKFTVKAMKNRAYTDTTITMPLLTLLSKPGWREKLFSDLDIELLADILVSAFELQPHAHSDLGIAVPHLFAELIEKAVSEEKSQYCLFQLMVYACINLGGYSAVDRMRATKPALFNKYCSEIREGLESYWVDYPYWVRARIRHALSSLCV